MNLIGYRSRRWAREIGLTHTGRLFGLLPVYVGDLDTEAPLVVHRWAPTELLDGPLSWLWGLAWDATQEEPAAFGIRITGELSDG